MAISIGPRGWLQLMPVKGGAKRSAKMISFHALGTAGDVNHPQFSPAAHPVWIGNMSAGGKDVTAFYADTGTTYGRLAELDTGTTSKVGTAGDTIWALYTDTGL